MRRSCTKPACLAAVAGADRAWRSPPSARAPRARLRGHQLGSGHLHDVHLHLQQGRRPSSSPRRPATRTSASPTSLKRVSGESGNQAEAGQGRTAGGLNVNPQAVPQCSEADLQSGRGSCAASEVGISEVTTGKSPCCLPLLEVPPIGPLNFPVYNLTPRTRRTGALRLPRHPRSAGLEGLINEFVYLETGDRMGAATTTRRSSINDIATNSRRWAATASSSTAAPATAPSSPCRAPATATTTSILEIEGQRRSDLGPDLDDAAGRRSPAASGAVRADRRGARPAARDRLPGDDLGRAQRPAAPGRRRTQHLDREERQRDAAGRRRRSTRRPRRG